MGFRERSDAGRKDISVCKLAYKLPQAPLSKKSNPGHPMAEGIILWGFWSSRKTLASDLEALWMNRAGMWLFLQICGCPCNESPYYWVYIMNLGLSSCGAAKHVPSNTSATQARPCVRSPAPASTPWVFT